MKRKKKRQEKQAASKRVNPFQLLYCRKHAGLSRADLAEAVDLPESTIRKLECVDVDELPRSYRDFKYLSSDKLDAIEARLKCAGQLAAVPNQPVTSEIIQYYERYRFDDPDMPETFFPAQRVVPKMIVFDFDGTLTERAEVNVWERLWLQLGYSQNDCANLAMEFFRKHITHEEWCNKTLIYFRDKKLTEAMVREIAADVKLIDGFGPTIQLLKENGIKLYITSGSVFTIISEALGDYANLFDAIEANYFSFDRHGIIDKIAGTRYDFDGKADFITKTSAMHNIKPNEVLFVGNSINDVKARRSGARTLLVNPHYTHPSDIKAWDDCIHKMTNLSAILPFVGDLAKPPLVVSGSRSTDFVIESLRITKAIRLAEYAIVGKYYRFESDSRQHLIDVKDRVVGALSSKTSGRPHILVAGRPGSGKSYFAEQLIEHVKATGVADGELMDLSKSDPTGAKSDEQLLREFVMRASNSTAPFLAVVDEVDAKIAASWPFEAIYKSVNEVSPGKPPLVFLLMGSGGGDDPKALATRIKTGERGKDLIDRITEDELHWLSIPLMSPSDDICVFCGKVLEAATNMKKEVQSIDKMACFFAISNYGGRPRQLQDLAAKSVNRIDATKSNLTYDHLFEDGSQANKEFWYKNQSLASSTLKGVIKLIS